MRDAGLDLPLLPRVRRRALARACRCSATSTTCSATPNDPAKGRQMPDHYSLAAGALRLGQLAHRHADHAGRRLRLGRQDASRTTSSTLVYFGDGATSSNEFHNGAELRRRLQDADASSSAATTAGRSACPTERQTASATFAEKGVAYGIPGVRVDGNDLFAVIKVDPRRGRARRARRRADADRGAHLPPRWPLDQRRPEGLPPRGEARCLEAARPARAPAPLPRARSALDRRAGQGHRRRARGRAQGRDRRRREDAAALARVDVRGRLRRAALAPARAARRASRGAPRPAGTEGQPDG